MVDDVWTAKSGMLLNVGSIILLEKGAQKAKAHARNYLSVSAAFTLKAETLGRGRHKILVRFRDHSIQSKNDPINIEVE